MTTYPPAAVFDQIAERYDSVFTNSTIGRAQRNAVWRELRREFRYGQRVLEINCGTGEDALMLARSGVAVDACDVSQAMIDVAHRRACNEVAEAKVTFRVLAAEELGAIRESYDGAFSNFGGLNCVADLRQVSRELGRLVRPGGALVVCLAGRFCAWESAWYGARGDFARATRRWRGSARAQFGKTHVPVFYPTARQVARGFAPWFQIVRRRGIGVAVPPSYAEQTMFGRRSFVEVAEKLDRALGLVVLIRALADHSLFVLRRIA